MTPAAQDHFERTMASFERDIAESAREKLIAACAQEGSHVRDAFEDYRCDFDATAAEFVESLVKSEADIWSDALYWERVSWFAGEREEA